MATQEDRIEWLKRHRNLWEGISPYGDARTNRLRKMMKDAGLYAPGTHLIDISVGKLVRIIRREERMAYQSRVNAAISDGSKCQRPPAGGGAKGIELAEGSTA